MKTSLMTFNYPSKLCTRLNTEKAFFFFINLEGHGSTQRQEGPAFMHRQMGAETGEEHGPAGAAHQTHTSQSTQLVLVMAETN